MMPCIGEPISWPRLEAHAALRDAAISAHVAECAACRACLEEIERDVVALPPLPAAAPAPKRARWWFGIYPALAAALAVAILLVVLRPRDKQIEGVATVKGIGDVVIDVVRERGGVVRDDARTFLPGDRWKVVVTCVPQASVTVTVEVRSGGGGTIDRPLPTTELACGNRVILPGAFTLDGTQPNEVCAQVNEATACVTIRPE